MGYFRGISIGIVSSNRVREVATIACCATDMIVKVSTDSYLGQHSLKKVPNRLSFKQYLFHHHRSIPIDYSDKFAMISIDAYRSIYVLLNKIALQGCRLTPITQSNSFSSVSIDNYCSINYVCKCVDRYLMLDQIGLQACRSIPIAQQNRFESVSVDRHMHLAQLNRLARVSIDAYCAN